MNFVNGNIYDALTLEELTSGEYNNKKIPDWKELNDEELSKLSTLFLNPAEYDDDTAFNFTNDFNFGEVFDEEYIRDKFPGFDDLTYSVLLKETQKLNIEEMFIKPDDIKPSADARRGDSAVKNNILCSNNEV